jgi:hypothetical protein
MTRAWPVDDLDPKGALATNARRILAVRMAELYAFSPAVADETAVEPLHDMRIAAKRLRYTLELFRAVFGARGDTQIERIKAIQEELGAIHDHDVRILLIEDELAAVAAEQAAAVGDALAGAPAQDHPAIAASALRPPPDEPRRGLIALLGRQHVARRRRYRAFRDLWHRLNQEGLRADLAVLSSAPLPDAPAPAAGDGHAVGSSGRLSA